MRSERKKGGETIKFGSETNSYRDGAEVGWRKCESETARLSGMDKKKSAACLALQK